jgi:hypothetical protein
MKKRLWATRHTLVHGHGVVDKQMDAASGSKLLSELEKARPRLLKVQDTDTIGN